MAIRMRYGLESQFDPSKMVVGEWAVSTDTRYVRMCFSPGIVLRMATYDAFEADMAKIKAILEECKDIQTAITRIQSEVNAKAVLCAEYAESAKESADAAAESANKAKMYAENASAVAGVQIATKEIAGIIKGGDNHIAEDGTLTLTARTNSGVLKHSHAGGIRLHSITAVEDRQDGVPMPGEWAVLSNNQLKVKLSEETTDGITYSDNGNGGVEVFGDATADVRIVVGEVTLKAGTYYAYNDYTNRSEVGVDGSYYVGIYEADNLVDAIAVLDDTGEVAFTLTEDKTVTYVLDILSGNYISAVFYPMIATESGATWDVYAEGYTEGYPQAIEATSMKNVLEVTAVSATQSQVSFDIKADKTVWANGTANADVWFLLADEELPAGDYILSGCEGGSASTYELRVGADGANHSNYSGGTAFTLTKKATVKVYVIIRKGQTATNLTFYPMIRPASVIDDTYVPYGCMRVVGRTAQLIPYPYNDTTQTKAGVTITDNGDGSVTLNGTSTSNIYFTLFKEKTPITEPCFLSGDGPDYLLYAYGTDGVQYTDKGNGIYLPNGFRTVTLYIVTGKTYNNVVVKPMINYGMEALPWQPYIVDSTIISKQFADFHNIGGVTDYLTSRAEVRRFAEVVFDGSDDEGWYKEDYSSTKWRFVTGALGSTAKNKSVNTVANALCDQFRIVSANDTYSGVKGMSISGDLRVFANEFTALADWKSYLAEHPMTVVYELAEEVVTMLPTADQIALHSLKSYDGVTHIYTDTYPQMVIDCEYGTSKVGAEMYETWNIGKRAEIENAELRNMITNLATALVAGSEG